MARAWGGGYGKGIWVEGMGIAWMKGMGRAWHGEILHVLADKRGMAEWLLCWLRQAVG